MMKDTVVIGANFKSASIEIRERIQTPDNLIPQALSSIFGTGDIDECVILSTCNRIEYYTVTSHPDRSRAAIFNYLRSAGADSLQLEDYTYQHTGLDAVRHLFKVASSLDSLVIGENQILGQVRAAYELAYENGTTGSVLNKLFQSAIGVGRRARTETDIGRGAVSMGSVSIELMKQVFSEGDELDVLLIGAGKIGAVTLEQLDRFGEANITIANRSAEKAEQLAGQFQGAKTIPFEERHQAAGNSDIVIVSTGAPEYVIRQSDLPRSRQRDIQLFIDLSVPRNIDPTVGKRDDTLLYCVDDLQNIAEQNIEKRARFLGKVKEIIEDETEQFGAWHIRKEIFPAAGRLKKYYREIAARTLATEKLAATINKLPDELSELPGQILEEYIKSLTAIPKEALKPGAGTVFRELSEFGTLLAHLGDLSRPVERNETSTKKKPSPKDSKI